MSSKIAQKIKDIEDEIGRMQIHKHSEHHYGMLKARLANLRQKQITEALRSQSSGGEGWEVQKAGSARVVMCGVPSAGKSSLLSKLTKTTSEVNARTFTTLTAIPGALEINGTRIQLVDVPGITEKASENSGKGKRVISLTRTADLVLFVLEASKAAEQKRILIHELGQMGIRINEQRPNVAVKRNNGNGLRVSITVDQTHGVDDKFIYNTLKLNDMLNADVIISEDITHDQFIDCLYNNRVYIPAIFAINKCDLVSIEAVDALARQPNTIPISVINNLGLDYLADAIYDRLNIVRIYTKKPQLLPDLRLTEAVILKGDKNTVRDLTSSLHKELLDKTAGALVWGTSVKFPSQMCSMNHRLNDGDVVQLVMK